MLRTFQRTLTNFVTAIWTNRSFRTTMFTSVSTRSKLWKSWEECLFSHSSLSDTAHRSV